MNDFEFGHFSDPMGFSPTTAGAEGQSGPYIPEPMECMRCAMCLGSCPTYKVMQVEEHSPRGRVRMIERLLRKGEVLSTDELAAFQACTLCRACETVCPSKVRYADLYHQANETIKVKSRPPLAVRLLLGLATVRQPGQRLLQHLLQLTQATGLTRLLKYLPVPPRSSWKQMITLLSLPSRTKKIAKLNPGLPPVQGKTVILFRGCVTNLLETRTHEATIKLLTRLGYDVRLADDQTCCGAMHAHNGDLVRAKACAKQNRDAFARNPNQQVIFNASGCGAFIKEYSVLLGKESKPELDPPTNDILDVLIESKRLDELKFRPLNKGVAVHEPCSQRNVLKNHAAVYQLLSRIPGLQIAELDGNNLCCGAGGTRMLTHPEIAEPLRNDKLAAFVESEAQLLVSSNITCALNLSSGAPTDGKRIDVIHPVVLLAQQLE